MKLTNNSLINKSIIEQIEYVHELFKGLLKTLCLVFNNEYKTAFYPTRKNNVVLIHFAAQNS
jgi:hypothetical protein